MSIIVGTLFFDGVNGTPVFWPDTNPATVPIQLNKNGATQGFAHDINNLGQIVGDVIDIDDNFTPVIWSLSNPGAVPISLNLNGGVGGGAWGINNLGQIAGQITYAGVSTPVLWADPGAVPISLNLNGGVGGIALDINDLGQIVGQITYAGVSTPVFWADPGAVPIKLAFTGKNNGLANSINYSGQIVGAIYDEQSLKDGTAVYWDNPNPITLPTILNSLGSVFSEAIGINNSGQIVGEISSIAGIRLPVFWSGPGAVPITLNFSGAEITGGAAAGISDPPPISNICFPAGTPVQTDQGLVNIELLDTRTHTINNKPIMHVTRTTTLDNYLIRFKPHALGRNMPHTTTLMTWDHKIMFEGQLVPAYRFLDYSDQVKKVKYNGETLYNVLLAGYGTMNINNLVCETLHPENMIAKLYTMNYTHAEQQMLVYQLNTSLKNKDIKGYKAVVNKLTAKK